MEIKRTYKPHSLKSGQVETVGESKAREVFGQTMVAHHKENECKPTGYKGAACFYCAEIAMRKLATGAEVQTLFQHLAANRSVSIQGEVGFK